MAASKPFRYLASAVGGAVAISILGFSMGWVETSGRAHADAENMSAQAVKDELVPICVYQFNHGDDSKQRLVNLRGMQEWQRGNFIAEKGWATMPGSHSPVLGVAQECAAKLIHQG